MSEEQADNRTHPTRTRNKLTPEEQHARKQSRFLTAFRQSGNIKHSCKVAGISRSTYYEWRDNDKDFQSQLPDADSDANDTLEYAGYDRAVQGVPSYVVSNGHMVYEEIPAFNDDGTPKLNKQGGQVFLRGKPLVERKYSDTLLITLLKARMPEKYKDRQDVTHGGMIEILNSEHAALLADLADLPDAHQKQAEDSAATADPA